MQSEESQYCAEVGHEVVGLYLYRCARRGEVVMHFHGGTCDAPEVADQHRFGPFDDWGDIRALALVVLTEWWERCQRG